MTQKLPKAERTDQIVRAAVEEFLEKGYEGASMEAIAIRAGLSKGAVYHHFKSKDDLLLSANQILTAPIEELMAEAERDESVSQGIRRFIERYLGFWKERPGEMLFFFLSLTKVLADKRLWSMWEAYSESTIAFYERLFRRGVENGEFIAHDCRGRGVALMSVLDGVIGYMYINPNLPVDWVAAQFIDIIIESIAHK